MSIARPAIENPKSGLLPEKGWRQPAVLLMLMAAAMQLSFAAWWTLQYNFAAEMLNFTGKEVGIQQSIREIPGFLSFAAVFLLFLMREQTLAMVSLALLGIGIAATGFFPSALGFYLTTFIGSIGFHYYETMHQSLTLQWLPKKTAPAIMGRIMSVGGFAQLLTYAFIFLIGSLYELSYLTMFAFAGGATLVGVIIMITAFPTYPEGEFQTRSLILRKRYWLYYLLTFMGGARRQIFMVFASWMMIEKFGYAFKDIAALFLVNAAGVMIIAPLVGQLILKLGERTALRIEYAALALIFVAYAFVEIPEIAIALYILDHAFFSFDIALKTYFQKIATNSDIAATTGVAFTINHIAAVFIPVIFGLLWLYSPASVFLAGAAMATLSLVLAYLIPRHPTDGYETVLKRA
ncbi:MFS transporter [Pseudahrensia aquimaris]|uniref:MFS transporter n=1 Tax=Pseudahrensia aquimaris TaxID=744461 RepID=A0ABW3FHI2_9HYPH